MSVNDRDPTQTPRQFFDALVAEKMAKHYSHVDLEPGNHTIGALCAAVMSIDEAEDAEAFYVGYLSWMEEQPDLEQPADEVVKANIGWFFGEGMAPEHIAMWKATTGAAHPVLGGLL